MICIKCGRELPDYARFCDNCGCKQEIEKSNIKNEIDAHNLTKKELSEILQKKGIKVSSSATKEDLVILVQGGKLNKKKTKPRVSQRKCANCGKFLSKDNESDYCDECSSSGGCFITTAVCKSNNLPDDCHELTVLRSFRDTYMKQNEELRKEVDEYYLIAPVICNRIDKEPDSAEIYEEIYQKYIKYAVAAVDSSENETAYYHYKSMVLELKEKYYEY